MKKNRIENESPESKSKAMDPEHEVVLKGVLQAVEELFRRHYREIITRAEREMVESVRIGFPVAVEDLQSPDRKLKVRMSWSMTVKDGMTAMLPDPAQPEFAFINEDTAKARGDHDLEDGYGD